MTRLTLAVLALALSASPAFAAEVRLTVPVRLSSLDRTIKAFGVTCVVYSPLAPTLLATGRFAVGPRVMVGGVFNSTITVSVILPEPILATYEYNCTLGLGPEMGLLTYYGDRNRTYPFFAPRRGTRTSLRVAGQFHAIE